MSTDERRALLEELLREAMDNAVRNPHSWPSMLGFVVDKFCDALAADLPTRDWDHCRGPAPSLFAEKSVNWCVRRPGHGVPHRDQDGAEWTERRP